MLSYETVVGNIISYIINPIILLLLVLAIVIFTWGVFKYIRNAGEAGDDRAEGARGMIWGIVGVTIMVSVFGIMRVIMDMIGL